MSWIPQKKTSLVIANNHGNLKPIYDEFHLLSYLETSYVRLGHFSLQPHDTDSSSKVKVNNPEVIQFLSSF